MSCIGPGIYLRSAEPIQQYIEQYIAPLGYNSSYNPARAIVRTSSFSLRSDSTFSCSASSTKSRAMSCGGMSERNRFALCTHR